MSGGRQFELLRGRRASAPQLAVIAW